MADTHIKAPWEAVQSKVVHRASRKKAVGILYLPGDWVGKEVYVVLKEATHD
jgi:hypothetical protein